MIEIKDVLSRFSNVLFEHDSKQKLVLEAIFKVTNIKIKQSDLKIKNNVIYLNIKPLYKSEIFTKQELIFQELKKIISKNTPSTIR